MDLLVLGKGFIGTYIGRYFFQNGRKSKIIGRDKIDLSDSGSVGELFKRTGVVDRLLISAATTPNRLNSEISYDNNTGIINAVAESIGLLDCKQVIYISSTDVYGPRPEVPISENTKLDPEGFYAQSKMEGEDLLGRVCSKANRSLLNLRLPGVYGTGDRFQSVVGRLIKDAAMAGCIKIDGDGSQKRDYLHVEDLARLLLFEKRTSINGVFNLSSGESRTLLEIAEIISKLIRSNVSIKTGNVLDPKRPNALEFDLSRLRSSFPSFETTKIEAGIRNYIDLCNFS